MVNTKARVSYMVGCRQVLVAGASSDIGKVIVRHVGELSRSVVIAAMRRKASSNAKFPKGVNVIDCCDLTRTEDCQRMADLANSKFNEPFGYVHSVGDFWDHVALEEFSPAQARIMFQSHVDTLYNSVHALIPIFKDKGGGSVVAFSCNSVRYNYPWMASFTSSKAAVESLIKSLAHEFSGDGIRFNAIALASVRTKKVVGSKPHGDIEHYLPTEALLPVIEFLLSRNSGPINGTILQAYMHSDRFYNQGYFERIRKD